MRTLHSRLQGLYVITDPQLHSNGGLEAAVRAALRGGAQLVQYRDKSTDHARRLEQARQLLALCREFDALLIINDDCELARVSGAHGVHLGRDDMDIESARAKLGADSVIGVSCYNELARGRHAAAAGADYLAFGSIFPSTTKPDAVHAPLPLLTEARTLQRPVCAIGGIDGQNLQAVINAGADMAAVVSAVFSAADIEGAARSLSKQFDPVE